MQQKRKFHKMHGLGNDFMISFDDFSVEEIISLANRNTGIGFDQALLINSNNYVKVYNADGNTAGFCGNGFRCIAALLAKINHTTSNFALNKITFQTDSGIIEACVNFQNDTLTSSNTTINFPKTPIIEKIDSYTYKIDLGNHHIVSFNNDNLPFEQLYKQQIATFGDINVFWVQEYNQTFAKVIGYERGAGLTQACGSGACAIASVINKFYAGQNCFTVVMPGGCLEMNFTNNKIEQTGPTTEVYVGYV